MPFLTFASFAAAADLHRFAESMGRFTPILLLLALFYFPLRRQTSSSSADTNAIFNSQGVILIALAFGLIVTAIVPRGKARPADLIGTWRYVREVDTKPDGSPAPPEVTPPECNGLLIYSPGGFMSVVITPKGRRWSIDGALRISPRSTSSCLSADW